MMQSHCPCCFIIPNDITREIAKNASKKEDRELALNQISRNSKLRERRAVLSEIAAIATNKTGSRFVHNSENKNRLPGKLARKERGKKTRDEAVDNSYLALGIVRDFLNKVLKYNSYDGEGADLISSVHYDIRYNNAFWDGSQMVYGDGDGVYFNNFTVDLEITAHELFHGVVSQTAGLIYQGESGALNESFCDIFGCLIKQWKLKQKVDKADWIIGKGLFTKKVKGVGVRKLDAPGTAFNDAVLGKDKTRGHYDDRYTGSGDYGGVHINSGIPSLAFVNAAKQIGGYAYQKVGMVWWNTLINELKPRSDFKDAATATIKVAKQLYKNNTEIAEAIEFGWKQVGVISNG